MLNPDVDNELKVYDLYIQRLKKEADLIWSRFKIYLGFNSGVLVAIGLLTKPYLIDKEPCAIPDHILSILIILCGLGMIFSVFWLFVNINRRKWQALITQVLNDCEDRLFQTASKAMFHRIREGNSGCKQLLDVVMVNTYLSCGAIVAWVAGVIIVLSNRICGLNFI